jgi:hypothetical protein
MYAGIQLQNKISGHESQEAWRQDELIGGKPQLQSNSDSELEK